MSPTKIFFNGSAATVVIVKASKGANFRGLLHYIFSKEQSALLGGNLGQQSILGMQHEFEAIAHLNGRVRYPVLHLSLSPHPDDKLSNDRALLLIDDMINQCGYGDCQWLAAYHDDTATLDGKPRPHYHVIINRVRLTDCRVVSSWRDWQRHEGVLQQLREEYGLAPVIDARDTQRTVSTTGQLRRIRREQREFDRPHHPRRTPPTSSVRLPPALRSARSQLQNIIDTALAQANSVASLGEKLRATGITTIVTERGIKFEKDGVWFAGYQLGKAYTLTSLNQRLEQQTFVRAIAPIIAENLVNQTRLVGQHHTAYWEGDQLVLMDNQRSAAKMRAVNKDGSWEPVGRSKLTDTDIRHFLEIDLRRRRTVAQAQRRRQEEPTGVEL